MPSSERGRRLLSGAALAALSAAAALFFAACSLSGYAAQGEASEAEEPAAVFTDYAHTVVDHGKKMLELKASRAELYDHGKKMILTDVIFSEYDTDTGELVSAGKADQAIYYGDTKDAGILRQRQAGVQEAGRGPPGRIPPMVRQGQEARGQAR